MAALASAVIVSAPQAKTYADTQTDDTQAVTEKIIDQQITKATKKEEKAESSSLTDSEKVSEKSNEEETANTKEKQNQQESSQLQSEKEINSKKTGFGSQALNHPAQATAVSNVGNEADNSGLEISEGKQPAAQKAGAEASTEPNYSEEEKNIKNYSDSERYKTTDLTPGSTIVENFKTDEGVEKDGFKFDTKNPSATSPSKTEYGYEIVIDKETGQRTYTKIVVSDSGRIPSTGGDKAMMGEGEKLTPDSPDVTYKPNEDGSITVNRNSLYEYEASEETLKHINNKDVNTTVIGMKDNYTQDNPKLKFFNGDSFYITYKVNPWPNENDKLELMKLSGEYNEKVFVQGQDIDTKVKVDNIDANAKDRLVGQVYNPITGAIVPGARAYIGDDGNIHIQMPKGALKKDENGKYVVDKESIFNSPDYKALQNLDVKFFARPRTLEEFKAIAETPDDDGETGTYVETGAGSDIINHKGKSVKIDKQGIDRYDHYNLVGKLRLNLDDTRYYDQTFDKKVEHKGDKVTGIKPGAEKTMEINPAVNPNPAGHEKTAEEMDQARKDGYAIGEIDPEFVKKAEDEGWKIEVKEGVISKFKVIAPKTAKAGDFIAIPITYTYTNGSTDDHWFHFVVQESDYIKPEYETQVNFPAKEQTAPAKVTEDGKRLTPDHYTLPDTLETDEAGNKLVTDDSGNKWTVTLDKSTGKVSAKPVEPKDFNGGEKLEVPVISHYVDKQKPGEDITEETNAYFVIEERANMTPRYNAKAGKAGDALKSSVILNEEDTYNRRPGKYTLDSDTFVDDKGNTWNVTIDEKTGQVTATVPNGVSSDSLDGALLNVPVTAHYYEENGTLDVGTRKTEVQFIGSGTEGKHKYTVDIPFETKVEKDPTLKKGEIKVIKTGELGSKEVTLTIKDSVVDKSQTTEKTLKEKQDALIHVGEGVLDGTHNIEEKVEVPFETIVEFDDTLAPGEQRVDVEGAAGEKTRTTTLTIEDGNVTKTESGEFTETKAPVNRVIKVGRNTEGEVVHEEKIPFKYDISYDPSLKSGEYVIDVEGT